MVKNPDITNSVGHPKILHCIGSSLNWENNILGLLQYTFFAVALGNVIYTLFRV